MPTATDPLSSPPTPCPRWLLLAAVVVLALGILVRVWPSAAFTGVGFDEALYRDYVLKTDLVGLGAYPDICGVYLEDQRKPDTITKLPPTRFLYIFSGWLWKRAEFGDAPPADPRSPQLAAQDPALVSLHRVSCAFSILMMIASGLCAWRMFGPATGLGVLAFMSFAPTQIHMGQHALIDGFFAFWATASLWMLWENLRRPAHPGWLTALGVCLAAMVLTKENAFFVYVALCGLIVANRWAKFGTVTRKLLAVMLLGPLFGLATLITLVGSAAEFVEIYRLLVSKALTLTYAIQTGDGPWYRYLVDLMLISPIVLCLAIGGAFTLPKEHRAYLFLGAFVALSYLVMCNVRYGMNLRYATIWDFPLRVLAIGQMAALTRPLSRWQTPVLVALVVALCAFELRQYVVFFVNVNLYELATEGLLRAVKILK